MKTGKHDFAPIGEFVVPIETWSPQMSPPDEVFDYIDIASIDRDAKSINDSTQIPVQNAPSRARQIVRTNDVLVSTVRPNLNAVAIVPDHLDGAIASTGFCVLRCESSRFDYRYLFHWVRSPPFVREMVRRSTGASYPAVTDRIVKESKIAFPPRSEQSRIADILDKAQVVRQRRREAVKEAAALRRSLFLEVFGDPAINERRRPEIAFKDTLSGGMRNGISPSRRGTIKGKVLVLSAITGATFDESKVKEGTFDAPFRAEQLVNSQEFLICRGNGNLDLVGAGRFPTSSFTDIVFPDTMIAACINTDAVLPEYLEELWTTRHVRAQIQGGARTTNGTHKVNQRALSGITFPLPPLDQQRQFAQAVGKIRSLQKGLASQLPEDLFNSLAQRAFKGKL